MQMKQDAVVLAAFIRGRVDMRRVWLKLACTEEKVAE
jgi:hypothetical protein